MRDDRGFKIGNFHQPRRFFFWSVSLNSILQFLFDEMIKAFYFSANISLKCKINSLKLEGEIIMVFGVRISAVVNIWKEKFLFKNQCSGLEINLPLFCTGGKYSQCFVPFCIDTMLFHQQRGGCWHSLIMKTKIYFAIIRNYK